ncbi:MAG: hypothetical protein QOK28_2700 [Actinomycetota bacterium]
MSRFVAQGGALDHLGTVDDAAMTAVEEILRLDGPVQIAARIRHTPIEIGGVDVPAGRIIILVVAAANRDPDLFTDPQRLDFARNPNPHRAFGGGIHYCIGAALARLELRVALRALAQLPGRVELAGSPRARGSFTIRGLESLNLRW